MSKDDLDEAVVINKRSEASNDKQGCKGIGLNNTMAILTKLESKVKIISKKENEEMVDMVIDYPEYMKKDMYNPSARTEPSRVSEDIFKTLVSGGMVNGNMVQGELESETGTVVHFTRVHVDVYHELTESIKSVQIEDSLLYKAGIAYNEYINEGKSIRFILPGDTPEKIGYYDVEPIDPLCRDTIDPRHQESVECELYINEASDRTQTRSYFMLNGNRVYTKNILDSKCFAAEEVIPAHWKLVGKYVDDSAYSNDWLNEQSDIIEYIEEIESNGESDNDSGSKGGKKAIEKRKHKKLAFMGGWYIQRNKKVIKRFPIADKKSGDFPERPFYDKSRHMLKYPVELDTYMGTQLNKSDLREENIDKSIVNAYKVLRNNFAHRQYLLSLPAPAAPPVPAPAPVAPQAPAQPPAPVVAPAALPPRAAAAAQPPQAKQPAPGPRAPVPPAPAPEQVPLPDPAPDPAPVIAHLRTNLRKKIAIPMLEHCNATPQINANGQYIKILSEIICITNGKGGDAQLARQIAFISNGDYVRLSECVMDYYGRNYSDIETVCGGSLLLAFYRELFPHSDLLAAMP
jgi:hypothetical protein